MVNRNITPELQLRHLPYKILRELAEILDITGPRDWQALVAELPDGTYTRGQIAMLEREALRPGKSSALALLTDLGNQLMTVEQFSSYLELIGNQEALLLLKPHEPVIIKKHPSSQVVPENKCITLHCEAGGFPLPRYQWFKNREPIPGARTQELVFKKIEVSDCGEYQCKVENPMGSDYSLVAAIQVTPAKVVIVEGVTSSKERRMSTISFDEETVAMVPGQQFVLNCDTHAHFYQWFKNGYEIPGACKERLVFPFFQMADEGRYSCRATDVHGNEILTRMANLTIASTIPNPSQPDNGGNRSAEFATGKLALIIANQAYHNPRNENEQLVHPFKDAKLLQSSLESINFKVITLLNLTGREMEAAIDGFCNLLKCSKGLYSLFYFCGHGFEDHGKTYLVPVDASRQWTPDCALSAEHVLSKIQHCKTTKLDVLLLDVCRVPSGNEKSLESLSSFDPPFMPGAQCVFGYATCPQSQAFEIRRDRNGIYMKHLAKSIGENIPIHQLLHDVGVEVRKEAELHRLTSTMSPTFKSTTTKVFSLADPVIESLPTGLTKGEKDLTQEWFAYHRLPSSQSIYFEHGIVIDIKFIPVCSNVCKVIVHVACLGNTKRCDAKIIEISDDLDVPNYSMNVEISLTQDYVAKSIMFDSGTEDTTSERSADIERSTRVNALQKLTGPFAMTIEVVYEHREVPGTQRQFKKHITRNEEFGIVSFFNAS